MSPTFTYQGVNASSGLEMSNATNFIKVNPTNGEISIPKICLNIVGTHTIKVVGTLPNQFQFAASTFTLIGVRLSNQPAQFMLS